ncbi:MAG: flagellar hook-basal body complex protein FliE [Stenotrophomonas acidaminiphila]|nr:MAG: flagellar hook-basal body complex protein FliE [Stenotrophomonas acidaminiphila]
MNVIEAVGISDVLPMRETVTTPPARIDFGAVVSQGVGSVDNALSVADQQVRVLAAGQEIAPHEVMISLEEARMKLMLLSEVRNRLVEAYQELTRMQL